MDSSRSSRPQSSRSQSSRASASRPGSVPSGRPPANNVSQVAATRPVRSVPEGSISTQPPPPRQTGVRRRTSRPADGSSTAPRSSSAHGDEGSRPTRRPIQPYVGSPLPPFSTTAPAWLAVSRGVALFLGTFLFLQLLGDIKFGIGASDRWWIDLAPLNAQQANGFLAICGVLLFVFALKPNLPGMIRGLGSLVLLAWAGFLGYTAYQFYLALHLDEIQSRFPVAFPLHLLAMLTVVFAGLWKTHAPSLSKARDFLVGVVTVVICFVGFPIAQMYCYGYTDHRRASDAIAVFGCRAYADGTPSTSLRNRVLTGAELYHAGLAPVVILSGGPGEGEFHETAVMKQVALEAGVPESVIVIDEQGWDTADTISNIARQFVPQGMAESTETPASRILAVSNFYHLPRIRLAAERAGLDCATVPATETAAIDEQALTMGREVAALWWYHVEPVTPVAAE